MKFYSNYVISNILLMGSLCFMIMYLNFMMYKKVYIIEYEVLIMNSSCIVMSLMLDWMSLSFMSFVMLISFVIILYSISYMKGDINLSFFVLLIFFFVLSMMLLIISPNLISILLGWDGLGLISYCLVIYYQSVKSYNAGMVTAMTNRIGDVLILISISWMLNFGSWNYMLYYNYDSCMYTVIMWLIVLAAMTKSAQIPFSSWLPAAMAAPTPVSALVHSSTLVTAGVYLLIRFNFIFENKSLNIFLLVLSVLTMFMSGLGAIFDYDLKKIIALSTLSQLGLMISSLCLGLYEFAFFHLLSHALFKSLLFMCAGYIIHGMNDCQDIRYMGGIFMSNPILCVYFNISNLSLCGIPFLAGFYSKDLILEMILMMNLNVLIFSLYFLSIFFTVVYTFRLMYLSMVNCLKSNLYNGFNDNDFIMLSWMFIMMIMVISGGSFLSWTMFFDMSSIILSFYMKMFVSVLLLVGIFFGYYVSKNFKLKLTSDYMFSINMLSEMWFLYYLSTYLVNYSVMKIGYSYFKMIDLGWGEVIGGQGMLNLLMNLNLEVLNKINKMIMYMFVYFMIMFMFLYVN